MRARLDPAERYGLRLTLVGAAIILVAVGTSRLFLGVHFVTDVVGGYVLGLAWLAGATATFAVWREEVVVDEIVTGVYDPDG